MLEKKIIFDGDQGGFLSHQDLKRIFWKRYRKELITIDTKDEEFLKIGSIDNPVNLSFQIITRFQRSGIREIDDFKLMSDALKYTKELRVIDKVLYQIVNSHEKGNVVSGEYVLTIDDIPIFNVKEAYNPAWIYKLSTFEYYNKRGILKHNPDLDSRPRKIEVDLSVKSPKKEKILVKMYNDIIRHYEEKRIKVLESK